METAPPTRPMQHRCFAAASTGGAAVDTGVEEESHLNDSAVSFDAARTIRDITKASRYNQGSEKWDFQFARQASKQYQEHLQYMLQHHQDDDTQLVVSPEMTCLAIRALLRCNYYTPILAQHVRALEQVIGRIGQTPLTPNLSLHLLQANGLAGNVGRTISLLGLRKARGYPPEAQEFEWAIQSLASAGLELRQHRNIYKGDDLQPALDNPTRFLDAILLNMHHRGVPLTTEIATKMILCYADTGRTGKATHFHYRVVSKAATDATTEDDNNDSLEERKRLVRIQWNRPAPYYKIPSEISEHQLVAVPGNKDRKAKRLHETEKTWSLPLTAAFSFMDSLTHGACGHDPIELDVEAYNAMLKVCCYRGAIWRALELLHDTMPQQGIVPNANSYLKLLQALARVGDTSTMSTLWDEMMFVKKHVSLQAEPVLGPLLLQAMVDGMVNASNIAGAISFLQNISNQYSVLPPYTTHVKVLELALASDLPYEAKRHVYFLQQCWRADATAYTSDYTKSQLRELKENPKLSKQALQQLFEYFGYELQEADFFEEFRDEE